MMKILLATGFEKLENLMKTKFADIEFLERNVLFREGVDDILRQQKPDIVILSEYLDGNTLSHEDLVRQLRKRHPSTRIVYILKEDENIKMRKFLYKLGIYDVFSIRPKLDLSEMYRSFFKQKEWADVHQYFGELDNNDRFRADEVDGTEDFQIPDDYSSFQTSVKPSLESLYMQIASFWSVRDQSGKTFKAVNTSLMLAQNTQQKVLLLDFNILNSNVHSQLNFSDKGGNHNLGAVIEDLGKEPTLPYGRLTDYLIAHSTYKNLHILPGFILKRMDPDPDSVIYAFDWIIKAASTGNYTSVLIDCDSGLSEEYTRHILNKSHKIFVSITESPGGFFSIKRCFDREVGAFFTNFLNLNAVIPVLNQSAMDQSSTDLKAIIESYLEKPIDVVFPDDAAIRTSVFKGEPLLKNKPTDEIHYNFTLMANHIHNVFVVPPPPVYLVGEGKEAEVNPVKKRLNPFKKKTKD